MSSAKKFHFCTRSKLHETPVSHCFFQNHHFSLTMAHHWQPSHCLILTDAPNNTCNGCNSERGGYRQIFCTKFSQNQCCFTIHCHLPCQHHFHSHTRCSESIWTFSCFGMNTMSHHVRTQDGHQLSELRPAFKWSKAEFARML